MRLRETRPDVRGRTNEPRHYSDMEELLPAPGTLRKVLVVGAGVAGLQTARQFMKLGVEVLVLETNAQVGGVWCSNYVGFGLQVPWRMYQFAEFPWPQKLQPENEYPTGQEVQEYILSYAQHFDLLPHVRLNSKLLRLRWSPERKQWDAIYCDTINEKFFKTSVDYVTICCGIYSNPFIPEYPGAESFVGVNLHAKDFTDYSLASGRRVLIVGAGKTALDCVAGLVASKRAASVTMLCRKMHWPIPRTILGVSIRRLLFNRAMTHMIPPYYTAGRCERASAALTRPLKRLFWKGLESISSSTFRTAKEHKPSVQLPTDLFHGGQILDDRMEKQLESESLAMLRGEINRFVRNGVILQDGSFLPADVVLYATGYCKSYDYLDGTMIARLGVQKDGLYLYRNCLPHAVPHLAFIGSEVSTYNNILTHGLQALWLAHVLSGRVQLPSPAAMAEDVREQQRWRREVMPPQRSRGSVLMLYMFQYHDQLVRDMGQATRRKGRNLLAECFGVYSASDYAPVLQRADKTLLGALRRDVPEQQEVGAAAAAAVTQKPSLALPPAAVQRCSSSCSAAASTDSWGATLGPYPASRNSTAAAAAACFGAGSDGSSGRMAASGAGCPHDFSRSASTRAPSCSPRTSAAVSITRSYDECSLRQPPTTAAAAAATVMAAALMSAMLPSQSPRMQSAVASSRASTAPQLLSLPLRAAASSPSGTLLRALPGGRASHPSPLGPGNSRLQSLPPTAAAAPWAASPASTSNSSRTVSTSEGYYGGGAGGNPEGTAMPAYAQPPTPRAAHGFPKPSVFLQQLRNTPVGASDLASSSVRITCDSIACGTDAGSSRALDVTAGGGSGNGGVGGGSSSNQDWASGAPEAHALAAHCEAVLAVLPSCEEKPLHQEPAHVRCCVPPSPPPVGPQMPQEQQHEETQNERASSAQATEQGSTAFCACDGAVTAPRPFATATAGGGGGGIEG